MRCSWAFCILVFGIPAFAAVNCPVAPDGPTSEARQAFLLRNFDKAIALDQATLAHSPNDPDALAGIVESLLREEKIDDAVAAAQKAQQANPHNAVVLTALADAQYRAGMPWKAIQSLHDALTADPCYARAHLGYARIARIESFYATASQEARTAHTLDPHDPEIRSDWIWTLPTADRIRELQDYLRSPSGDDPEDVRHMRQLLDFMQRSASEPHKACRLVSATTSTEFPFAYLMEDSEHIRAFGLKVRLNGQAAQLQIDTGAGGIVVSRSVAERAGLKAVSQTDMGGIGSQGFKPGYTAYADSIRVGDLEFQDCAVRVLDSRSVVDQDGLIGMDVFSDFLVTLDYPMRKMTLGPLPPRPGELAAPATLRSDPSSGNAPGDPASNAPASSAAAPAAHGPFDRYTAPAMKNWSPIYRVGHELLLPVTLDRKTTRLFILDTGAWSTTITPEAAREVTKLHSADGELEVRGLSGKVKDVFYADKLTLYFANLSQPAEQVPAFDLSSLSRNTGMEVSGLIGANTIDLTTLDIDYRDGLIHFDYRANRGYMHTPGHQD